MSGTGFNPNETLLTANPAAQVHVYSGGAGAIANLDVVSFTEMLANEGFKLDDLNDNDKDVIEKFIINFNLCKVAAAEGPLTADTVFCTGQYINSSPLKKNVLAVFRKLFLTNLISYSELKAEINADTNDEPDVIMPQLLVPGSKTGPQRIVPPTPVIPQAAVPAQVIPQEAAEEPVIPQAVAAVPNIPQPVAAAAESTDLIQKETPNAKRSFFQRVANKFTKRNYNQLKGGGARRTLRSRRKRSARN